MTPAQNRPLGIGLSVVAAGCLIFAAFTTMWLVADNAEARIGFGLRDNHMCTSTWAMGDKPMSPDESWTCESMSNSDRVARYREWERPGAPKMASSAFAPLGWVTFVDALAIAAALLAAAGIATARKHPQLPITPTTIALLGIMIALVTGCVFVATKPVTPSIQPSGTATKVNTQVHLI